MGWRTILVSNVCKLSYKNEYLVIRSENVNMIHLSEINMIVIENRNGFYNIIFDKRAN